MTTFISALRNGAKLLERRDDDGFDRLSNRYTVGILVMFAVFISTKSYVGDPIDCWHPKEFAGNWGKYTDNYCWISNTYYVPINEKLSPTLPPGGQKPGEKTEYAQELTYYQWVPIILVFCAGLFAVPAQLWAWASNAGGYEVEAIVKATRGADNLNPETREKTITYLVNQMGRLLGYRRPIGGPGHLKAFKQQHPRLAIGRRFGHFLFIMYLVVKCLYIAMSISLLWILNAMLGGNYHMYGIETWKNIQDPEFQGSERFPYVTLCDFWVRTMGENQHKYTVQCVLPVNLFNEKVFIIIWFWLVFVAAASILGLILWIATSFPAVNKAFVCKYLTIMGRLNKGSSDEVDEFIWEYLRLDGVFTLRLIMKNTNDAIGGEIVAALWDHWQQKRKPRYDPTTEDFLPKRQADEAV